MSKNNKLPSNEQIAQYLDQEVPMQQLEADELNDLPAFMQAQLIYAKSTQGKNAKRKQAGYKNSWFKNGGKNE